MDESFHKNEIDERNELQKNSIFLEILGSIYF